MAIDTGALNRRFITTTVEVEGRDDEAAVRARFARNLNRHRNLRLA